MILTIILSLLGLCVIIAASLQANKADVARMNGQHLIKRFKK